MNWRLVGWISLVASSSWASEIPKAIDPQMELVVVGVYRPVELTGRTLGAPREVYLAAPEGKPAPPEALVGQELPVIRRVPVPATLPVPPSGAAVPATAAPPRKGTASLPDSVTAVRPIPTPTRSIDVLVGRLRVVAVRDGIVVAQVVADRLAEASAPPPVSAKGRKSRTTAPPSPAVGAPPALEMPVVMAGDLVRFDPPPIRGAPPPPGVDPDESARLRQEKAALEAELRGRTAPPPGKYTRPDARWDL